MTKAFLEIGLKNEQNVVCLAICVPTEQSGQAWRRGCPRWEKSSSTSERGRIRDRGVGVPSGP